MLCESKHVTVKVRKTETGGNTFLTPHGVSPRLELFCFSNEARALDLMIKPSWSLIDHTDRGQSPHGAGEPHCKDKGTLWLAARLDNLGKATSF